MSTINSTTPLIDPTTTKQNQKSNGTGKDDFLQLLAAQMKYQNPLEPLKDTEFIAQMAQFSSLEQLQNLNQQSSFNQAVGLIGFNVFGYDNGNIFSGQVEKAVLDGGVAQIVIDGQLYKVSDVFQIEYPVKEDSKNPEEGMSNGK